MFSIKLTKKIPLPPSLPPSLPISGLLFSARFSLIYKHIVNVVVAVLNFEVDDYAIICQSSVSYFTRVFQGFRLPPY